jgi:branched-chain amino acid transport system ATP-binding protein
MTTPLLEVRDLEVAYGELPVVSGVSFVIEEGTVNVLLGLNGAGKTTTVAAIAGLLQWSGFVTFEGETTRGQDAARLVERGISLVPEGRRVFPSLTVEQNLRLGAWVRRKRTADVRAMQERVFGYLPRLQERRGQLAGTLSGGEQQMLALGRALMSRPRLMLIDEASLGLSPRLARTVFDIVSRINDDGVTVLMVEQNIAALRRAHHAFVMEKGVLVWEGSAADLRDGADIRRSYLGVSEA